MSQKEKIDQFMHELSGRTVGAVRTDDYSKILYSTDASMYQVLPHGVLLPETDGDVHAAVELAAKYQMPLLPRTGGSSLVGQCTNEALVIDFTRHLNDVIELNVEERWVRVRPGIVLDVLNNYLKPYGLKFGPDPASSNRAAMGGIVSNNSTGSHSILYGMTADHVLETKVILSDGSRAHFKPKSTTEIMQYQAQSSLEARIYRDIAALTFNETNREIIRNGTPNHWRRCGGYNLDRFVDATGVSFQYPSDQRFNLAKLICGAEGTMAVIEEIKLNLVPLPKASAIAIVHFGSLREALDAVPVMMEVEPSAVELMDNLGLRMCREVPEYARLMGGFVEGEPDNIMITEFYGETHKELVSKIERLQSHLKQNGVNVLAVTQAMSDQAQEDVWTVRKVGLGLLMSIKGDYKPLPFIEDSAVPVEHLTEYITRIEQFCNELGTDVAYYAHASGGCLHVRPLVNVKVAKDVEKLPLIAAFAVELLGEYGGSWSSEHGDGKARSWLNETFFGKDLYGLYKQTKTIFDPHNLMNPGNVVDGLDMTQNLRYGADYSVIPLRENLDFSIDQGFHRAVEMCNGAGICRKTTGGTMCPSYQVTLEEEQSTRGRANALRAAMSGRLDPSEFTSKRMYEVMDLCVSCKACKAECPSSVDMAKVKREWLAHYLDEHGVPLRSRLFANIGALSKVGNRLSGVANWGLSFGLTKAVLAQAGVSAKRDLPAFAEESLFQWFGKRKKGKVEREKGKVVLLTDTYTSYNFVNVAKAGVEVLEWLGYEVVLSRQTCVGRPAMSKGLLSLARKQAKETLTELLPYAEAGVAIVGLEPSDVSAVRDDYASLLPEDARVDAVAKQTVSFEEFVAEEVEREKWKGESVASDASHPPLKVLLHGHCHQKALIGTKPAHRILEAVGYEVEEVDSGCCGMAGSFGYEAEHYEVSMQMAERRLLPKVREQGEDVIVVASGVSCREQIRHGTGRRGLHSAEALHRVLCA